MSTLIDLLKDVQLENYQKKLNDIQITRIEHFAFVKAKDLEVTGLSKPAIRRLLNQSYKYNKNRKTLLDKVPSICKTQLSDLQSKLPAFKEKLSNQIKQIHIDKDINISDTDILIKKQRILGKGSTGTVVFGIWYKTPSNKIEVALKILEKKPANLDIFLIECKNVYKLKHKNVIQLYGIMINAEVTLVMELSENGTLLEKLKNKNEIVLICHLFHYVYQICKGMCYLENLKFIHCDLALRNILISHKYQVKIGDFGLMRKLPLNSYKIHSDVKIAIAWSAPESLEKHEFSSKSDAWMFAVVLWEIFTFAKQPWLTLTSEEVLKKLKDGKRLEKPDYCSETVYRFMLCIWQNNCNDRPNFQQIKKLINKIKPVQIKSLKNAEFGSFSIKAGDSLTIINDRIVGEYSLGQNNRTGQIGEFLKSSLVISKITKEDIGLPIRDSFIHTGHSNYKGLQWGYQHVIDDIYIRNPAPNIDTDEILSSSDEEYWGDEEFEDNIYENQTDKLSVSDSALYINDIPNKTNTTEQQLIVLSPQESCTNTQMCKTSYTSLITPMQPLIKHNTTLPKNNCEVPIWKPFVVENNKEILSTSIESLKLPTPKIELCSKVQSSSIIDKTSMEWLDNIMNNHFKINEFKKKDEILSLDEIRKLNDMKTINTYDPFVTTQNTSLSKPVISKKPKILSSKQTLNTSTLENDKIAQRSKSQQNNLIEVDSYQTYSNKDIETNECIAEFDTKRNNNGYVKLNDEHSKDKIEEVRKSILGVTRNQCRDALSCNSNNVSKAKKYLQVEQLHNLGIASKDECRRHLIKCDWNMNNAASSLLNQL